MTQADNPWIHGDVFYFILFFYFENQALPTESNLQGGDTQASFDIKYRWAVAGIQTVIMNLCDEIR